MPTDDKTIAQLHQRASSHYLQGEFDQALAVWRELLSLDSADERALEGVRLCELLADDEASAESPSPTAPAAPATAAASATPAVPATPARDLPDPSIQAEGIDIGDVEALDALPLAGPGGAPVQSPAPTAAAGDLDFDFDIPESPPAAEPEVASATGLEEVDPASAQLNQRIEELYDEALQLYEQGQAEPAMGLLCRLFILDESNAKALALQERIHADSQTSTDSQAPPPPEPVEDLLTQAAAPEPVEDLLGEVPLAPSVPAAAAPAELDLDDSELDGPAPGPAAAEPEAPTAADPVAEAPEAGPAPRRPARPRAPVPRGLAIGLSGVALAVVAVFVWLQFFAGGTSTTAAEQTDSSIAAIKDLAGGRPDADGAAAPAPTDAAEVADEAAEALGPQDIDALLAEAGEEFAGEDYAAAVLVYNKILELDPDHVEAAEQLKLAGDLYREQHERQERWNESTRMFEQGNYRGALQALYRMESDDPARQERYKRNAWFNLALISLASGDCSSAQSHFEEARAIDDGDTEAATGIELAQACLDRSDRSWYERARQLRERKLDD